MGQRSGHPRCFIFDATDSLEAPRGVVHDQAGRSQQPVPHRTRRPRANWADQDVVWGMLWREVFTTDLDADRRRRLLEALLTPAEARKMTYQEFLDWADEDTLAEGKIVYAKD